MALDGAISLLMPMLEAHVHCLVADYESDVWCQKGLQAYCIKKH